MKFRTKILLAIWGVVLVLLLITSLIVRYWTEVQVRERSTADLRGNVRTVHELMTLRGNEILKSAQIVAETPRMKAIVEIGDRNTARQLVAELNRGLAGDVLALTDSRGNPIVALRDGNDETNRAVPDVPAAGGIDIRVIGGEVYRIAAVPLTIGADRVGGLTLGFRIGEEEVDDLRSMTNSDVAIAVDDSVVRATLAGAMLSSFARWFRDGGGRQFDRLSGNGARDSAGVVRQIETPDGTLLGAGLRLDAAGHVRLLLLRPIGREVDAAVKPVISTVLVLSVIVLLITAVIGFFISQGITKPIGALIRGTAEIGKGNYDVSIDVGSDAEMRALAERFQDMSAVVREKMRQLADRNEKLEDALRQLKEMQSELLRSERLAATGKMTAQLAHEINNPVHNIQSCLQTLTKRLQALPSADGERELLGVALEEVERLARLTRQMLDVYKTSFVPLELKPLSINAVLEEAVAGVVPMMEERTIRTTLRLDRSLPLINGSADKLKQVFLNLFLNARDAMPSGGEISVETRRDGASVVVAVADTGVGIAPENINRIFDAFFTTKSAVSGVGLGLAVTYGIIRQHDGTISVRSAPGRGTEFTVALPAHQS